MKRPAVWSGVSIVAVALLQMGVTFWFLVPHIDDRAYVIHWSGELGDATGWHALMPYHAWPILATYAGALVALAIPIGVAVCRYRMQQERQAIAKREAAADDQEEQVRIALAESDRIQKAARNQVQEAREEVARCKQEAAEQVKEANDRLQGSVNTNIGRQKTIQNLRERVKKLEEEGTMGHC